MSYFRNLLVNTLCPTHVEPFFQIELPGGKRYSGSNDLVLGRKPDVHPNYGILRLDADTISREHAFLQICDGAIVISDLCSRNGTYVGNKRVAAPRILVPGDVVTLGGRLDYDRTWVIREGVPIKFLGAYF
ncbi:FHA domain-containing protein [Candidatus Woesearchaeota archaeon]|nr:FHA domain-containing protein [Candidatus Woesearchaeota archaeon]